MAGAEGLAIERDMLADLCRGDIRAKARARLAEMDAAWGSSGGGGPDMRDEDVDDYRGLGWEHGALTVQRLGAMMAPVTFLLPDGRQVSPLHIAPWAGDTGTEALPGILRRLRGDWPCAPFGYSVPSDGWPEEWARVMGPAAEEEEVHGHSSNHEWRWHSTDGYSLKLFIEYPLPSPSPPGRADDHAGPAHDRGQSGIPHHGAAELPVADRPAPGVPFAQGGRRGAA